MKPTNGKRMVFRAALAACAALAGGGSLVACGSSSSDTHPIGQGDRQSAGGGGGGGPVGTGGDVFVLDGGPIFGGDGSTRPVDQDASCGETTIVATPRKVNVLLVIDESGSMTEKPAGFSTDKWTAMKTALSEVLTASKSELSFGLELFPSSSDPKHPIPVDCSSNCCDMAPAPGIQIPVDVGTTAVPEILTALDASAAGGGTPTASALSRALDYFTKGAGKDLEGDRYVLLATDGGPDCNSALSCDAKACTTNLDGECPLPSSGNCCDAAFGGADAKARCLDDTETSKQVTQLAAAGVDTFVVGIPGSEAYSTSLDAFARAGGRANASGTPAYYAVSAAGGVEGLASVLSSITGNLVKTCSLALTSNPPDRKRLNVEVDGRTIPKGADGWELDDTTSPPSITLLGSTCQTVESEGAGKVHVLYGCPTILR